MLQSRPLYDNRADSKFFVCPEQWDSLLRSNERGLNVLIIGPRGIGKTTLLRQMQRTLRAQKEAVVFADATAAADVLDLTSRIRNAFHGEPSPIAAGMELAVGALGPRKESVAGASRAVAVQLDAIGDQEPSTILVDASAAAEAVYELFGRLRDQLWQQPHHWVVAIGDSELATVVRPPADAFFDQIIKMEPWSINQLAELLLRRANDEEDAAAAALVPSAATAGEGNPRKAIRALGDAVVTGRSPGDRLYERGRLLERASDVGRAPAMLMAELLDREQASPSDEDLQATLGVTRARLTQMFRQLQDAGLVQAAAARPDGPGRPRTIYRPALSL